MTQADIDRNEIIEMARQAGASPDGRLWLMYSEDLEAFAKLVIEKCATVCENTEIEGSLAYGSVCAEKVRSMGKTT